MKKEEIMANHPNRSAPVVHRAHGEWSGYEIRRGKRGWIIESWSRVQGCITGAVRLVYFNEDFPADLTNWDAPWNEHTSMAQALAEFADHAPGKTLRMGHVVY